MVVIYDVDYGRTPPLLTLGLLICTIEGMEWELNTNVQSRVGQFGTRGACLFSLCDFVRAYTTQLNEEFEAVTELLFCLRLF